ncbi:hypothetical protein [Burkholderia stagnalis]|uniref:hypothetical protein n=1 Tax=Burkholderia stagnalis TaxID=1503054 RepID=UPI000B1AB7B6|nr:hypothetical protein [Burkholderia stagnalis]
MDDAMKEMGAEVMKYQFPIATMVNGSFEIQGTCVAITDGDHHFLVTASHVTNLRHNAASRSLYICNWAGDEFIRIEEDIVGFDSQASIPNEFDASIIKIDRSRYQSIPDGNFLDIGEIYVDRGESFKRVYAASGFPASKNRSFPRYKTSPNYLFFLTDEVRPSTARRPEDAFTIRLSYDHSDAPKPNGMSGGGLWIFTAELPSFSALAGILVSWLPGEKIIIGAKMDYIVSAIRGFFPGSRFDDIPTLMTVRETENGAQLYMPIAPTGDEDEGDEVPPRGH